MAVEPRFSSPQGPESIKPSSLRAVNYHIERYYDRNGGTPERSKEDADFWILGMADEDVPPLYKLPKPHAVYVIMCQGGSDDQIRERAEHFNVEVSDGFLFARRQWGTPYYIGYTQNPYRRINEHWDPFTGGAWFTKLFPPRSLQDIDWYDDEETAKKAEKRVAKRIQQEAGGFINPSLLD